jgi:hypothetical protein
MLTAPEVFVSGLCNDALSSSDCTVLNNRKISEWRIGEEMEVVMTYLKVLSCHLPGETEENYWNSQSE